MNHRIKMTDTFTVDLEAVKVLPKITIGRNNPVSLTKVYFKYDDGQYNGFVSVDFMGQNADVPAIIKLGRKYSVTMTHRGTYKIDNVNGDKVFMSFQGIMLGEL